MLTQLFTHLVPHSEFNRRIPQNTILVVFTIHFDGLLS